MFCPVISSSLPVNTYFEVIRIKRGKKLFDAPCIYITLYANSGAEGIDKTTVFDNEGVTPTHEAFVYIFFFFL